ncbi:MAG: hypothetical protein SH818_04660 [Saprospiraceae bacterium]|nr:hypothetical protein [Saprospiraceae bacterium]
MKKLIIPLLLFGSAIRPGFYAKQEKIIEFSTWAKKTAPKKIGFSGLAGFFSAGTPDGF